LGSALISFTFSVSVLGHLYTLFSHFLDLWPYSPNHETTYFTCLIQSIDKGSANFDFEEKVQVAWIVPVCFGAGFVCSLIWVFILGPIAKVRIETRMQREANAKAEVVDMENGTEKPKALATDEQYVDYDEDDEVMVDDEPSIRKPSVQKVAPPPQVMKVPTPEQAAMVVAPTTAATASKNVFAQFANNTFNQDLHAQSMHESAGAAKIWGDGIDYDPYAESLFNYIQVFTACLNSFAHGANDVSNTIAPLSAIIYIYQKGEAQSKSEVQKWVLAFGGAAIVLGLLL
jgi:solute carrier family 20 (sodium-dependent phosphate transporter)